MIHLSKTKSSGIRYSVLLEKACAYILTEGDIKKFMSFVEKGNDHYVWRKRCPIYAVWDSLKTQILLNNYRGQFRGGVYFDNEDDALTAVLGKPLTERCDTDLNHYRFAIEFIEEIGRKDEYDALVARELSNKTGVVVRLLSRRVDSARVQGQ